MDYVAETELREMRKKEIDIRLKISLLFSSSLICIILVHSVIYIYYIYSTRTEKMIITSLFFVQNCFNVFHFQCGISLIIHPQIQRNSIFFFSHFLSQYFPGKKLGFVIPPPNFHASPVVVVVATCTHTERVRKRERGRERVIVLLYFQNQIMGSSLFSSPTK